MSADDAPLLPNEVRPCLRCRGGLLRVGQLLVSCQYCGGTGLCAATVAPMGGAFMVLPAVVRYEWAAAQIAAWESVARAALTLAVVACAQRDAALAAERDVALAALAAQLPVRP